MIASASRAVSFSTINSDVCFNEATAREADLPLNKLLEGLANLEAGRLSWSFDQHDAYHAPPGTNNTWHYCKRHIKNPPKTGAADRVITIPS